MNFNMNNNFQQMNHQQMFYEQQQQMMAQLQLQQQMLSGIRNNDNNAQLNIEICVIFRVSINGQPNVPIMIQCTPNEKVSDIIEKYRNKANDYDDSKKFIFNAKNLNPNLSAAEAGITNNANIFVVRIKRIKNDGNS